MATLGEGSARGQRSSYRLGRGDSEVKNQGSLTLLSSLALQQDEIQGFPAWGGNVILSVHYCQTPRGFNYFCTIWWLYKVQIPLRPVVPYEPDLSTTSPSRAGVEVKARWVARKVAVKVTSASDVRTSSRCLTRASRVPARSLRNKRGGGVGAWGRQRASHCPFLQLCP